MLFYGNQFFKGNRRFPLRSLPSIRRGCRYTLPCRRKQIFGIFIRQSRSKPHGRVAYYLIIIVIVSGVIVSGVGVGVSGGGVGVIVIGVSGVIVSGGVKIRAPPAERAISNNIMMAQTHNQHLFPVIDRVIDLNKLKPIVLVRQAVNGLTNDIVIVLFTKVENPYWPIDLTKHQHMHQCAIIILVRHNGVARLIGLVIPEAEVQADPDILVRQQITVFTSQMLL